MFEYQNKYKQSYEDTLRKINSMGVNIKNDEDKIQLLNWINNLKRFCELIEPQDSYNQYR